MGLDVGVNGSLQAVVGVGVGVDRDLDSLRVRHVDKIRMQMVGVN